MQMNNFENEYVLMRSSATRTKKFAIKWESRS